MAKRDDFLQGVLMGLYNSGVGNPAVNEARADRRQAAQIEQTKLNASMAEKGMIPSSTPQPKPGIGTSFARALFPGSNSAPLQTAFVPNPEAVNYAQLPTGEVKQVVGPVPAGSAKLPLSEGQQRLGEQYKTTQKPKASISFDSATALFGKDALPLIKDAQARGLSELDANAISTISKAASAKGQEGRADYFASRNAATSLGQLPSTMGAATAPGAAYMIKVSARQGKALVASPGAYQQMGLASGDAARAVLRAAPTEEALRNANFSDTYINRVNAFKQRLTSDPAAIDQPEMRKTIYDLFNELDKSATPWISNHMESRKEKGFTDSPEELKRQLGENIQDIPFNDGTAQQGQPAKIRVSNGIKTFDIPSGRLQEAMKDGYKQVQ